VWGDNQRGEIMKSVKLGSEWQRRLLDVCGLRFTKSEPMEAFITHLHRDHLPFREEILNSQLVFKVPEYLIDPLRCKYPRTKIEIEVYTDVMRLPHTFRLSDGRFQTTDSYAYFIGNALVIPECNEPARVLEEYRAKVVFTLVFHQSHNHLIQRFDHNRDDIDFLVDNRTWDKYKENVIPKVVYSRVSDDIELYRRVKMYRHESDFVQTNLEG
jgi:hypothetical protein